MHRLKGLKAASAILLVFGLGLGCTPLQSQQAPPENDQPKPVDTKAVDAFQKQVAKFKIPQNNAVLKDASAKKSRLGGAAMGPISESFRTFGMADLMPAINAGDSATPWQMLSKAILDQVSGGQPLPGMQVIASPIAANWNDAQTGAFVKFRVLGDTQPTWGSVYYPSSLQISNGYRAFIANLAIPLPDKGLQNKAEKGRSVYLRAVNDMEQQELQVISNWKPYDSAQRASLPQARWKTYDQWFSQYGGPQLSAAQNDVNLAAATYDSYLVQAYKGFEFVSSLAADFNNPGYQLNAVDDNGQGFLLRTYNITPDLGAFITESQALPANATKSFSLNKSSGTVDTTNTSWGGSASWGPFFHGSAGGSTATLDTHNDKFSMQVSAKSYRTFTITPGRWFNGTAIQAFQCGPWLPDGPVANGSVALWGKEGVLSLMPVQIVVAFQPKIVLQMSSDNYHSVKTSISSGGGISIGPFGFGASYHRDTSHVAFDDASNTITAEDPSNTPQVVAVISTFLPNSTRACPTVAGGPGH